MLDQTILCAIFRVDVRYPFRMKKKILIQLDSDAHPSVFDRVVAVDAGVDALFAYGNVTPGNVEGLVHGAMFTRGPQDLHQTAIFIGGSSVTAGEALLERVTRTFFGPLRVSVMLDANGANTTAAAAVLAAGKHLDLAGTQAVVLGGTGPVGQRVARLLAGQGATVRLVSRSIERATPAARSVAAAAGRQAVSPHAADEPALLSGAQLVVAAGAAGVQLLTRARWESSSDLRVAIDLNAVPPAGIESIDAMDKATARGQVTCYGAIGVGGTKMKIHKAAVASLFESNDRVLDAESIYAIGKAMQQP
jgi:hypothetical protein